MKVLVLLLTTYLIQSVVGYGSGISNTVFSVGNYQAENGGFTTNVMDLEPGNLGDTAHALFLASLFGVKSRVNSEQAQAFLQTVKNSDGGYADKPGQPSSLESIRNALLSYHYLDTIPYDISGLTSFVHSLHDANSKLFRDTPGTTPDYRATARALQIFDLLDVKDAEVGNYKAALLAKLTESKKEKEEQSYFSSITSDNYFAILVADLVGFTFEDPKPWRKYFQARQVSQGPKAGGFYADEYATDAEVHDAEYAVHALYILNGKKTLTNANLNLNALSGFLNSLPPALNNAAHAYAALARTQSFQEGFKLSANYVVKGDQKYKVAGNRIVQGSVFRPSVFFRTTYGQPHAGAVATAEIAHADKTESAKFTFNEQTGYYESEDHFDSANLFGDVSVSYTMKFNTAGFEDLVFVFNEKKSIGYDLTVTPKATLGSEEFAPGEEVGLQTEFNFAVALGTVATPSLKTGEFKLTFSVIDSSSVVAHTESIDGRANSNDINFKYELSEASFPAGDVTFRFEVSNENGIHTVEDVTYSLRVSMVAGDIDFDEDQILNLGQKLSVSMQPGTLYDGAVHHYAKGSRRFFLDVHSAGKSHVRLGSFPGQARSSGDSQEYVFEISIPSRFDFLGTSVVTFRYVDNKGQDVVLKNYDSEENELFKQELTYQVEASLELVDLEGAPEAGALNYGDEISMSFKVQDSISETFVQRGSQDSTVFLALKHTGKDGKSYASTKVRGVPDRDETGQPILFNINWAVDANAAKEPGQLVLYTLNADMVEIPLKHEGSDWAVDVTVAGSLKIDHQTYSRTFDDSDTSFFVTFDLSSNDRKLSGAEFVAKITGADGRVIDLLPVAAGPEGAYQVSWNIDTDSAKTGNYAVDIFKKGDVERSPTALPAAMFSISLSHQGRAVSPLPFKTEFLALLLLGALFVVVSVRKTEMERKI